MMDSLALDDPDLADGFDGGTVGGGGKDKGNKRARP